MADTLVGFIEKSSRLEGILAHGQAEIVAVCAEVAKGAMESVSGAPHTVAKKPIAVRVRKLSGGDLPETSVGWYPRNAAVLVNSPTASHFIRSKRQGSTKRRRQRVNSNAVAMAAMSVFGLSPGAGSRFAIKMPPKASGWSAFAFHHGTKGKHFGPRGVAAAQPLVAAAYRRQVHSQIASVFG